MANPIWIHALLWAGVAVLFVLCLPIARVSKFILEISTLLVRVGLVAILAAGAYLWFNPAEMPVEVISAYQREVSPQVQEMMPAPGTPLFGLVLAAVAVLYFLPMLAVLDVTRLLAGRRLKALRRLTDEEVGVVTTHETATTGRPRVAPVRGSKVQSAADRIASARESGHGRSRISDYVK